MSQKGGLRKGGRQPDHPRDKWLGKSPPTNVPSGSNGMPHWHARSHFQTSACHSAAGADGGEGGAGDLRLQSSPTGSLSDCIRFHPHRPSLAAPRLSLRSFPFESKHWLVFLCPSKVTAEFFSSITFELVSTISSIIKQHLCLPSVF